MHAYYIFISRYEYCAFAIYTCFSTSVFYNYTYLVLLFLMSITVVKNYDNVP